MTIVVMKDPGKRRGNARLTDQEVTQLAALLARGEPAGDDRLCPSYQTAYNRAKSAQHRVLCEESAVADRRIWPEGEGFKWALVPASA